MFKKSLILLTSTAILLPMTAVPVVGEELAYEQQDRSRAGRERVERRRSERGARQPRAERRHQPKQQNSSSRPARSELRSEHRDAVHPANVPVVTQHQETRVNNAPQRRSQNTIVRRDVEDRRNNQRSVRPDRRSIDARDLSHSPGTERNLRPSRQSVTHTSRQSVKHTPREKVTHTQRTSRSRKAGATSRAQPVHDSRRVVRDNGHTYEGSGRAPARRYLGDTGHRKQEYSASKTTRDSRRAVRGNNDDHNRHVSRTRQVDYARDHNNRHNSNWDRGHNRDHLRGNYRQNWWYRDRWYRDVDIFFGFSPYYSGFGFNVGYYNGHYNGYYNGYYYGRDYYFGHWPVTSGYYSSYASWRWNHRHHHYHYGDYCPHAYNNTRVTYYDGYRDDYYRSSSSGDQIAGILLGGIVGGIIGAEIDGGHNKTAGAVIGSVVGAAIGASATNPDGVSHSPKPGVVYDTRGRHAYETETYMPPREIRTCLRYETRQGQDVCTKWTVEYDYDD